MNRHSRCCRPLLFCLVAAIFVVPATMGMTHLERLSQQGPSGDLSVVGEVTVNGTSAISGATVFSDSTVTTAKGSSAVVSLGKLGRVEVLPESTMKLSFTDSSIKVSMLDAGRVRVSSSSGVAATATTRDGEVNAKGSRLNEFTMDTSCGDTFVSVKKGSVALRAGDTVKQIAAGSQDTAGTARPGCTPGGGPGRRQ